MFIDFDNISPESRVWIHQCSRSFSEEEQAILHEKLTSFVSNWQTHGKDIEGSFDIIHRRFIVIAANHQITSPSGCSIDAMTHLIQELEQQFKVILLDKINVSFKQGEYIAYKTPQEFKTMVKNKSVTKNTIVFNNIVNTVAEFKDSWEVPAMESWHKRFFL